MNNSRSKFLSLILRHKPETIGIKLDKNGWASVSDLSKEFSFQELRDIAGSDEKNRYEFNQDNTKIRARQGHSNKNVEVELEKKIPPVVLYHGTKEEFLPLIKKKGLLPMNRHHVHLSADKETATSVADRRKGKSVILQIDCAQMVANDIKFYISSNNVWLCDAVHPRFIIFPK